MATLTATDTSGATLAASLLAAQQRAALLAAMPAGAQQQATQAVSVKPATTSYPTSAQATISSTTAPTAAKTQATQSIAVKPTTTTTPAGIVTTAPKTGSTATTLPPISTAPKPASTPTPLSDAMASLKQITIPSTPAPVDTPPPAPVDTPAQQYNTAPSGGTAYQDTQSAQSAIVSQMNALLAEQKAAADALAAQVRRVASPENYQAMLDAAMKQMMPLYESQKKVLSDKYVELGNQMDINQEQRGVYSAGFSADQYRKQQSQQAQDIAAALATIQANAVGETRQNIAQQLQALGIQGDLSSTYGNQALSAYGTQADINQGLGQIGLSQRGQDIQQNQFGQTLQLDRDKLAQDASQFKQTYTLENAKMAQDQKQFDSKLAFDQTTLDQSVKQWTAEMAQKDTFHADDMTQFAQQMGLNWAQLGAQQAAQVADASYRAAALDFDQRKFDSDLERQDAAIALDNASEERDILGAMWQGYQTDTTPTVEGKKANMLAYASFYRDDPALYNKMTTFINNTFASTPIVGATASGTSTAAKPYTGSTYTSQGNAALLGQALGATPTSATDWFNSLGKGLTLPTR